MLQCYYTLHVYSNLWMRGEVVCHAEGYQSGTLVEELEAALNS